MVPSRDKFDTAVTEMTYIGLGLATVSMAYSFLLALARCAWPQDAASRLSRSFANFFRSVWKKNVLQSCHNLYYFSFSILMPSLSTNNLHSNGTDFLFRGKDFEISKPSLS